MERLSKSEIKRQHKQVEMAARELLALNKAELGRLNLADEIIEAIQLTRSLKGGALKRQTKYIAKLLKEEPIGEILEQLKRTKGSKLQENKFHHLAEYYRDEIINEALDAREQCLMQGVEFEMDWSSGAIDAVVAEFPDIDEIDVRRSAYQYVKNRNKVHYRELFRAMRAAVERKKFAPPEDSQSS